MAPLTSTPPGGASDCNRAAMFTTSPATIACPPSRAARDVDQRLAGGHADPEAQAAPSRVPVEHPLQFQAGPHAAHRVGLGGHRRAEQGHHRVADVLLDDPAVLA